MERKADRMPAESIRGRIRRFLETHHQLLGPRVIEIGSRVHDEAAWYIDNRDLALDRWIGLDMQAGAGVNYVHDIERELPPFYPQQGGVSGILCSEVLEHVRRPWLAIPNLFNALAPGGAILITIPFAFHIHAYPHDYFRYTPEGLRGLLEDAGFIKIHIEEVGSVVYTICNHEPKTFQKRAPQQVFAYAFRPA